MKKIMMATLVAALLLSCVGCADPEAQMDSRVLFYYLRNAEDYVYGTQSGVVTWEERDDSAQSVGTTYLLSLYLMGPLDENLRSPFPAGCRVKNLVRNENELTVVLNENFTTLKGMNQTLACVCLARTCMSITGVQVVHIQAETFGGQLVTVETVRTESLLLEDAILPTENPS